MTAHLDGLVGSRHELLRYLEQQPVDELIPAAKAIRGTCHGRRISFSRKVFVPLTKLCRDVCHYCTFAETPETGRPSYLTVDQAIEIAQQGKRAGCNEALFTLGERPELRYRAAKRELEDLGFGDTLSYLRHVAEAVLKQTGLLPHLNPGAMSRGEMEMLRPVSASMGMMLESASQRLCERGGPHFGSPDKHPAVRLKTIEEAGELRIPFTTGILIGIGETRRERLEALAAIAELHERHGHIQELIIQNFRAKADTRLAKAPEPDLDDLRWTIAAARILFGPSMNIQAPPNLTPDAYVRLIEAGLNDWGGISPVTPDHVNPEAPWPLIESLARATATQGFLLVERLAVYPEYLRDGDWLDPAIRPFVRRLADGEGLARADEWSPGVAVTNAAALAVTRVPYLSRVDGTIAASADEAMAGRRLDMQRLSRLFEARDIDYRYLCEAADQARRSVAGDVVRYVVNRNINYTNICTYRCGFCAFSKGKTHEDLRGRPYDLSLAELSRRVQEAWARGATEVCMQGGIHPDYTGETYLEICRAVKSAVPEMHVHAFSPLEITQGARTLSLSVTDFLEQLKDAGLGSLPGTAAEILDDSVRSVICPDKITTAEWLNVIESAHKIGILSTATIMFGHVDGPENWARHLLAIRDLQSRTGGFTEFVPLPFIAQEAPLYLRGGARRGPTLREAVLMHAIARLALHPLIPNIQTSWVKLGRVGVGLCLKAGANDLGGTLMNESISRAAGTQHGQEMPPAEMRRLITAFDRTPQQRTTLYSEVSEATCARGDTAMDLAPIVLTPPSDRASLSRLATRRH